VTGDRWVGVAVLAAALLSCLAVAAWEWLDGRRDTHGGRGLGD
jgi:uncharacterized protein involved in exopolysaccharide biosynthesis